MFHFTTNLIISQVLILKSWAWIKHSYYREIREWFYKCNKWQKIYWNSKSYNLWCLWTMVHSLLLTMKCHLLSASGSKLPTLHSDKIIWKSKLFYPMNLDWSPIKLSDFKWFLELSSISTGFSLICINYSSFNTGNRLTLHNLGRWKTHGITVAAYKLLKWTF